ncbi:membrane complex biogenesis protein, BtpA family [Lentibacillus kapialis]|uniref:Membrane complex biogenesis protein, BtpA family n=1 Tax=Lentibacillus kapialis TaxID=340214 RepID=A0A917Q043_9BACI|nr:BtpA/SgcQ family protein [Lentibacillus kapialis]GGK02347.1 membrane complex biogenesis protein, BtpA family [Lentibacillus kapialis]
MSFLDLFKVEKPILAMLHLKGDDSDERVTIAKHEIDKLIENGVDGVIVENYFGDVADVEAVLKYINENRSHIIYGVNVLRNDNKAFELANHYNANFIQLDSVAGHLNEEDDKRFNAQIKRLRESSSAYVLGGVRFKYQPYLSGRPLEEDLSIGKKRCDGIVVTGSGTGVETDNKKIEEFRTIIGPDFPLVVGAGLTKENCMAKLSVADAGIVGSYLKENGKDDGLVSTINTDIFMEQVKKLRGKKSMKN